MKKFASIRFVCALASLALVAARCHRTTGFEDILKLLPEESELPGWAPQGDPQTAAGDDLYLLIDGGAETYLQYGFSRAAIHSYEHGEGGMLNLEIYEMADTAAAGNIFHFKTGAEGAPVPVGDEAILESYYLNVRKGRYVMTVIGLDPSETTRQALLQTARVVESRIENPLDTAGDIP